MTTSNKQFDFFIAFVVRFSEHFALERSVVVAVSFANIESLLAAECHRCFDTLRAESLQNQASSGAE
jgi:hypothetical protein